MTVKKWTERQIKWSLILFKYDIVINYIARKNNERANAFSKREQDVSEVGDVEYKMAQLPEFRTPSQRTTRIGPIKNAESYQNSANCYRRKRG